MPSSRFSMKVEPPHPRARRQVLARLLRKLYNLLAREMPAAREGRLDNSDVAGKRAVGRADRHGNGALEDAPRRVTDTKRLCHLDVETHRLDRLVVGLQVVQLAELFRNSILIRNRSGTG